MKTEDLIKIQETYFTRTHQNHESTNNSILIIGMVSNNMGDESVGAYIIHELSKISLPKEVFLVLGGIGNVNLLDIFSTHRIIIAIDAVSENKPLGEINVLFPENVQVIPNLVSTKQIGFKDQIAALDYMGEMPEIALFTVNIKSEQTERGLSLSVKAVMPDLLNQIQEMIPKILSELD